MKKYRVNGSEHFNLMSMYDHLKALETDMLDGELPWDDGLLDRIEEVEKLLDAAPWVGSQVNWPTLKRIREIQAERQMMRYGNALATGASERDAAYAFDL